LSLNEEVVHGIPTDRELKKGDILGIDIGLALDGYYSDTAATVAVGDVPKKVRKLLKMTEEALETGSRQARDGNHVGDIGQAVEQVARKGGFGIVRDLFGHGVGTSLHMDPLIPNFGKAGQGVPLKTGMAIAIEPMFNLGGDAVETLPDGWTVVTKDGSLSAHFEHTLVITEKGPEVLTNVEKR
jgi:methionyl aminopeptidase